MGVSTAPKCPEISGPAIDPGDASREVEAIPSSESRRWLQKTDCENRSRRPIRQTRWSPRIGTLEQLERLQRRLALLTEGIARQCLVARDYRRGLTARNQASTGGR